ncbi:MAG TPA: helix-turn-helix domain-containing protein, partial [Gillisia sp.]|nr:helix-turn-helix domain-containing protein [Gillisia sp.]
PDLETVKEMHCKVHHSYPSQIIQIEEDLIETFLKCIEGPGSSAKNFHPQSPVFQKPIFCAVMVMNLYGSDPYLTGEYHKQRKLFEDFRDRSQKLVRKNKGRIARSSCDSCIYSFDSIFQSIRSALQIQHELSVRINRKGESTMMLGIGICGVNPSEDCDVFDETYNLARRLCYVAGSNQIVVSSTIREQFPPEDYETLVENNNLKSLSYKDEQFLTRLMDIIEINYREDLKIGDFCKTMGESRSQLYRKIIEVTNLSPLALINEFRLKRAAELMNMKKGNNISQIAFEAGFNNLSYFSKRFKKRFGLCPTVYMNRRIKTEVPKN